MAGDDLALNAPAGGEPRPTGDTSLLRAAAPRLGAFLLLASAHQRVVAPPYVAAPRNGVHQGSDDKYLEAELTAVGDGCRPYALGSLRWQASSSQVRPPILASFLTRQKQVDHGPDAYQGPSSLLDVAPRFLCCQASPVPGDERTEAGAEGRQTWVKACGYHGSASVLSEGSHCGKASKNAVGEHH